MKAEFVFIFCALCCQAHSTAVADPASGCPSYGCLPSGTFALSSDIPGVDNRPVGTRWTALLTGQLDSLQDEVSRLGCLSCQEGVVCATQSGYVSVDQLKGKVLWRYDNMTSPSLPVLDIYGDVIGTDGRHLVKIDADGTVQKPVIKFYDDLNPMYSIQLTNNDLMLLTTFVSGELITYGTDGIVEASIVLRGQVERVNGSFLPVAQPVISGMRAYILVQFVPDLPLPQSQQAQVLGLQRLYAVDLWRRMVDRIAPVWYFNFEREKCSHGNQPSGTSSSSFSSSSSSLPWYGNSVLVHNGTVYISLNRPQGQGCGGFGGKWHGADADEEGTLWAIQDKGAEPEVLFKTPAPVSDSLALYDVTVGQQPASSWKKRDSKKLKTTERNVHASPSAAILWSNTGRQITGFDSHNGTILVVIDVSKLLNVTTCHVTSKVMVTRSEDRRQERLVFAVSMDGNTTAGRGGRVGNTSSVPYVVAVSVDLATKNVQMVWKVAGKAGTEIVGQIPNVLFVPPAKWKKEEGGKGKGEDHDGGGDREGVRDDVETLLVATAVSQNAQFSFGIGHV